MTLRLNKIQSNVKGKSKHGQYTRRSVFSSAEPELDKIKRHASKQLENSREFAGKKNTDPFNQVANNANSWQESGKKSQNRIARDQVFSTYPSLAPGLRWSPSVDSVSEDIQEEGEFTCRRCRNCKETFVPERRVYRDNIIRFCDNSTMTLNVDDAACEMPRPRVEAAYSSTVSISTSGIAVRDEPEPQECFAPTPILRRFDDNSCSSRYSQQYPVEISEAEADIDGYTYMEACPKARRAMLPTCPKKLNEISSKQYQPKKILYNEGISDAVADNFPNYCQLANRLQVPVRNRNHSKTSVFSKNLEIPFAHQSHSKYHHECKTEGTRKPCFGIQEEVRLAAKPKALRTCHPGGLERCELAPRVKMPRKVLSSERDIDSYIRSQNRQPKFY